ncbi:hypothetical protein HPB51_025011 [Rhipicephalus microplus]|uniref:Uncharacterized protein n=1 Tax=Rhipicephalus microplus TaxID=6941 RepID=A0A9J6E5E2_RHIMP|nr:hypothetical protein HPB51_025011 [Rhipicephalus microplus]
MVLKFVAATSTNGLFPTVESATKRDTTRMCAHSLLTHRNVKCAGIHYHPTTTSAALLACFVVATTRRLPNHAQSGFCHQSTDANHPGQLLPPRRPSHHLPAPDGRAVRVGVQPGEGAIPGISRGPSEETRHRGAVLLAILTYAPPVSYHRKPFQQPQLLQSHFPPPSTKI